MEIVIRRLDEGDAEIYRSHRIEMIEHLPEAYGQNLAEAEARAVDDYRKQLAGPSAFFGAFDAAIF